ncbi:pseudouridine synthase [Bacteroidota bacterium]
MQKNKRKPEKKPDNKIRLNKYLADAGVASRRKADELIKGGAVKVNGGIIIDLGTKINLGDKVSVFGDPVKLTRRYVYILLNKPKDSIATTNDEKGRRTVLNLVRSSERIFPVGRLDRNTTGVILLTNDGDLTYRLTHPKYKIERVYNAGLDKELRVGDAKKIAGGIELEDGKTSPCELFINPKDKSKVALSLTEGKNHEIKRMFEAVGYRVNKLDRKFFAGLSSAGLKRGEYRHLTKKELLALRKLAGLKQLMIK